MPDPGKGQGMRQTSPPAPVITCSHDFPAVPAQAREARQFLAALLDGRRDADEAVLCLSELVGNACLHSRSREPAGGSPSGPSCAASGCGSRCATAAARGRSLAIRTTCTAADY